MFLANITKNIHLFSNSQSMFTPQASLRVINLASECFLITLAVRCNVPGNTADGYHVFLSLKLLIARPLFH